MDQLLTDISSDTVVWYGIFKIPKILLTHLTDCTICPLANIRGSEHQDVKTQALTRCRYRFISPLPQMVGPQKGECTLFAWGKDNRASWVKAWLPDTCRWGLPEDLAPGWDRSNPHLGEEHYAPLFHFILFIFFI